MSKIKEIKLGKRGYKAIVKNNKFNFGDGKHIYEVIELGYDFGEYGTDDFDEDGFAETAVNIGYRWNETTNEWYNK